MLEPVYTPADQGEIVSAPSANEDKSNRTGHSDNTSGAAESVPRTNHEARGILAQSSMGQLSDHGTAQQQLPQGYTSISNGYIPNSVSPQSTSDFNGQPEGRPEQAKSVYRPTSPIVPYRPASASDFGVDQSQTTHESHTIPRQQGIPEQSTNYASTVVGSDTHDGMPIKDAWQKPNYAAAGYGRNDNVTSLEEAPMKVPMRPKTQTGNVGHHAPPAPTDVKSGTEGVAVKVESNAYVDEEGNKQKKKRKKWLIIGIVVAIIVVIVAVGGGVGGYFANRGSSTSALVTLGEPCSYNQQCYSNMCSEVRGVCVNLYAVGDICASSSSCITNRCVNAECV